MPVRVSIKRVSTSCPGENVVEQVGYRKKLSKGRETMFSNVTDDNSRTLVAAIEQMVEMLIITHIDGIIRYCNPAFEKITGYSKEETIGQNPRFLQSGRYSREFYEQLWSTIRQGKVWKGRLINKRKDGSYYNQDSTISPVRDACGDMFGFVALNLDATEKLELERLYFEAQKLESVGRLAGGLAHDFSNLLTVINGYCEFLLQSFSAADPSRRYAAEIGKAGAHAASLTKQLLAFSRRQVVEPRVLDLNTVIRGAAPMLQRLIGEDITIETHLDGFLGQVMADPEQIHQIIMNLLINARDAMPAGGKIDVETMNISLGEDAAATHPDAKAGRYVLMRVTDTGHGIDDVIRPQIFEPFFTTKEVGRGTGLGLSTVYGIVRQSGGWVDVWSGVGIGTSFKIYLPRIDKPVLATPEKVGGRAESRGETILLVEDQDAVRSYAKEALEQYGYHIIEASSGDLAIGAASSHIGEIHLLLTDVVMVGMNGHELSERLQEFRPSLKALFVSGYGADVIARHGVLDGVAFLQKPFSPDEIAAKVRQVLDAGLSRKPN
jgi:two-component system cell cycle sensor histidine kinase/response regulator CckA